MDEKVVAVTGVPCTGKSTLAHKLGGVLGVEVIDLTQLVKDKHLFTGYDECMQTLEVNLDALQKAVNEIVEGDTILDGLLSHHLSPTHALVLRCDPHILRQRMRERGYSHEKIMENLEAEYVGTILEESLSCPNVLEADNTEGADIEEIVNWYQAGGTDIKYVDWSTQFSEILKD